MLFDHVAKEISRGRQSTQSEEDARVDTILRRIDETHRQHQQVLLQVLQIVQSLVTWLVEVSTCFPGCVAACHSSKRPIEILGQIFRSALHAKVPWHLPLVEKLQAFRTHVLSFHHAWARAQYDGDAE